MKKNKYEAASGRKRDLHFTVLHVICDGEPPKITSLTIKVIRRETVCLRTVERRLICPLIPLNPS